MTSRAAVDTKAREGADITVDSDALLEGTMVSSKHHMETETVFRKDSPIADLVGLLRHRKTVGILRVDLSQGAVQKISVTEKTKPLTADEFEDVEEVLDMGGDTE